MTPEAQKLRDAYERGKADYAVYKRLEQKLANAEYDLLRKVEDAEYEVERKEQAVSSVYFNDLTAAQKKARRDSLKKAKEQLRQARRELGANQRAQNDAYYDAVGAEEKYLQAKFRLEDLGYKVNPMAAKKATKKPSAKQLAARRKFAAAAKARSKAAKAKKVAKPRKKNFSLFGRRKTVKTESPHQTLKRKIIRHIEAGFTTAELKERLGDEPGYKAAYTAARKATKGRRKKNTTIIKAKKVTLVQLRAKAKKNPALEILKEAKSAKRGNQQGWLLGKEFIPKGKGTKKLPGGALFDTNAGFVYRRVENPKRRRNVQMFADGHPIRASVDYDPSRLSKPESPSRASKAAQARTRKAKQKSIKAAGGVKSFLAKRKTVQRAAAKRKQSRAMIAATKQRKATTTRLASRSLQRSYPLKGKRRNPNAAAKAGYESFQGKTSTKSTALNFPNGTSANVYKLGTLHSIKLANGSVIKPSGKTVWLCADTKGKLHLGTSGERLVNHPKGSLGKVAEVEYITSKPHLGEPTVSRYFHKLGEETGEKPTLYSDGNGGLIFKGGAYGITSRGIVN